MDKPQNSEPTKQKVQSEHIHNKQKKQINQIIQAPSQKQQKLQSSSSLTSNNNNNNEDEQIVFSKICKYLQQKKIQFKIMQHEATRTSQQSAIVRKTPLQWGSKTMLVNGIDNGFILLIYRAHMKVSWKKIRKLKEVGRKAQMANQQQVHKLGVKPGGVPPFPKMIGLKGILDSRFKEVDTMAFNAGHKCKSIIMKTSDFPLEDISIGDFTQE